MIYLFAGDDTDKRRASREKLLGSLPKEMEVFSFSQNGFEKQQLQSFYSGSGLFFGKCAVLLEDTLSKKEDSEFILKHLPEMDSSGNVFIFTEGKQTKPVLEAFKKAGAKVFLSEKVRKERGEKYNNFLLANALGVRDKLSIWLHFCRAMKVGVTVEELAGVLFWKAKDMILKKNFSKFSEKELKSFASKISYLLPEARKEGRDAEAAFERFLLEVV